MRICFIDCETTGTNPDLHHLWEVGVIVREFEADPDMRAVHGTVITDASGDREYAWQVWPDLQHADPQSLRVGRFYQRARVSPHVGAYTLCSDLPSRPSPDPAGAEAFPFDVAATLAKLLDGALLAGVQVGFDAAFVNKFLRMFGLAPTWNYHLIDLLSLAAGRFGIAPPWTSGGVTAQLGLPDEHDRHTGLGDARLNRDIFDKVYADAVV